MTEQNKETIEEFRQSLSYGRRTDLLFKVLGGSNLTDSEVMDELLELRVLYIEYYIRASKSGCSAAW